MKSIEWMGDRVRFIDQTRLPFEEHFVITTDFKVIAEGICSLAIRGAPLIGISAAYAIALAAMYSGHQKSKDFFSEQEEIIKFLSETRPTAVNLACAMKRMRDVLFSSNNIAEIKENLINEAVRIHNEDIEMCRLIGEHGSSLVPDSATILTICNTGILATGGSGTAQSVITTAHNTGKNISVFACETRPALQGARLTTWELTNAGVDVTLITDNMAATLMTRKKIDLVVTGADRIAKNGDSANKIGTYMLAILARFHNIPFYIAAPSSTIDLSIVNGSFIPIEERNPDEVRELRGVPISLPSVKVWNPSFDVTPAELITSIITDKGVHTPPYNF